MIYYEKRRRAPLRARECLHSITSEQADRLERLATIYVDYIGHTVEKLGAWVDDPVVSLEYRRPIDLVLESEDGLAQVQELLMAIGFSMRS